MQYIQPNGTPSMLHPHSLMLMLMLMLALNHDLKSSIQ